MRRSLSVLLGSVLAFCQAVGQDAYRAELSAPLDLPTEKQLRADLLGLDREHRLTVEGTALLLTLRWDLDAEQLTSLLAHSGTSVTAFERLTGEAGGTPKAATYAWPVDFPVRLDTGFPLEDDARYEQLKSTWIAAYPELYRSMTAPGPPEPPGEHE